MTTRRALGLLIVAATLGRLAWAAALGPGNDEAYYAQYARHPDWSYHDHPPLVGVLAGLGLAAGDALRLPPALALRWPFVLLFAGSTWLIARLAAREGGGRAGLVAAALLSAAGYFPLAAGAFALPDGPLVFFTLLTLDRLRAAFGSRAAKDGGNRAWLAVGLAWGGALLSKYHAGLIPVGVGLFLALEPRGRCWLRRPGPYLALAVGLVLFAPVIGWNTAHGWSSLAFQTERAVPGGMWPRPDRLAAALGAQALYLTPWVWLVLAAVTVSIARRGRSGGTGAAERFWLAQAAAPLAFFAVVALGGRPVLPHWALIGYVPLLVPAAVEIARRVEGGADRDRLRWRRRLGWMVAAPALLAAVGAAHYRAGLVQKGAPSRPGLLAVSRDPTADLYGWDDVAAELRRRGLAGAGGDGAGQPGAPAFVFTSRWYHSGQLAFALGPDAPPVLCYSARAPVGFADWSRPEEWVGRDGVLVVVNHSSTEPACYDRYFERIEPLGAFEVRRAGGPVKQVRLYRCARQTRPFPFDGDIRAEETAPSPAAALARSAPDGSLPVRR